MHAFKDDLGRTWEVEINLSAIQRVRAHTGLDLLSLVEDDAAPLVGLLTQYLRLYDVVYALCKAQADAASVSYDDFGRGWRGDAIDRAIDAFHGEFADFFPQPQIRAGLKRMREARGKLNARATALGMARLEAIDLDDLLDTTIASSGNGPASSASTPDPSPSASSS